MLKIGREGVIPVLPKVGIVLRKYIKFFITLSKKKLEWSVKARKFKKKNSRLENYFNPPKFAKTCSNILNNVS